MSGEHGANGLTRRAALRGAAVAGAAIMLHPTAGLALGDRSVFSRYVGRLDGDSVPLAAPRRFSLVGVEWSNPAAATISLRTRARAGAWSPWATASILGHGPDHATGASSFGEPIWTGPADFVQLRSHGPVDKVRVHFVAEPAAESDEAHVASGLPLAQPILDAGPGQPSIIARGAWAGGQAPPRHLPEYGTVKLAFVHHSETPNGYGPGQVRAILRSIYAYHVYVRGFWDIAYNFAVDAFGRIWEARDGGIDQAVIGAQAGGYNEESTGVVVLGSFMAVVPPRAAIAALESVLAWKLSLHGIPTLGRVTVEVNPSDAFYTPFRPGAHVSLPRVAGHRDGDQTSCPGDALYGRLPSIRPRVASLAGTPGRLTIAAPVALLRVGAAITVTGSLSRLASPRGSLAGPALPDETIEIQEVGAHGVGTTIATVTTDPAGDWTYPTTVAQNVMLRALHRAAPTVVSDIVVLSVAPQITLTLASSAPLLLSGTISPAGPPLSIDLYRVAGGRRHHVAAKHPAVVGGQFTATFGTRRAGRYVVVAHTPATARYAAAAAPPLKVTIP